MVLTRRGKQLVAVIPVEDLELLTKLEDRRDLAAARKALREEGSRALKDVKADLGL